MKKNASTANRKALQFAAAEVAASVRVKKSISRPLLARLVALAEATEKSLRDGGRVYLFGNGGSAADAQHIAAELQGRLRTDRPSLPVLALTTNSSTITAIANDHSFREIFSRQLESLVEPGDIAIGITTSGTSANVLAGLRAAQKRGGITAALTGSRTGKIKPLANHLLAVPSTDTQRIQEVHILFGHILCDLLEQHLFAGK